jgi:RimJ/RimL family protein N-acetyltransferase
MLCPGAPILETPRLILRGWRNSDFEPYSTLLADPEAARFITRRGRPYRPAEAWAEMAFLVGHWQMLGFGLFAIEAKDTGKFLGRAGPFRPEGWPALEIAWALAPEARGRGYASEAAAAAIGWTFDTLAVDRIVSIIHPDNAPSQAVARRLGERRTAETFAPFREPCDVWELRRPAFSRDDPPAGP